MTEFSKFAWYRSLASADLTDTEFRVLVLLANYADGKTGGSAHPSIATLASETNGKSERTVRRTLASLVAKGWLDKTSRPGTSVSYRLTTPATQVARVTDTDPGHLDGQGRRGTPAKSVPTPATQVAAPPGHLDGHRSDQGSDPKDLIHTSDPFGEAIQDGHPADGYDEIAWKRSLPDAEKTNASGNSGWPAEPATASEAETEEADSLRPEFRPSGLQPAARSVTINPFAIVVQQQEDEPPTERRRAGKPRQRSFGERMADL